jgi:cytochrome P450
LDVKAGRNEAHKDASHPTILKELIDSNLPPQEKTMERLQHEGQVIVGAGLETVKWTMCVALFHILDKPEIKQCLDAELLKAWPDIDDPPKLAELESLPYLTAVIQEGGYSFVVFLRSAY